MDFLFVPPIKPTKKLPLFGGKEEGYALFHVSKFISYQKGSHALRAFH